VTAGELRAQIEGVPDGEVVVGIRPDALRAEADGLPSLDFRVEVVEPLGDGVMVHGSVDAQAASVKLDQEDQLPLESDARAPVTARFDPYARPTPGETLRLGVAPERIHVFDASTGVTIR